MIEIGKTKELEVVRIREFGVYLADPEDVAKADENRVDLKKDSEYDHIPAVLLPIKQVPEDCRAIGSKIQAFVYKDSSDRLISTVHTPKLTLGEIGILTVKDTGKVGAFLDWGLEKDLFLPYKEQVKPVKKGDKLLVAVYLDKSERLCATTKIYKHLSSAHNYQVKDEVWGTVYGFKDGNLFVAVENRYYGKVYAKDVYNTYRTGQTVWGYVEHIREDGKLDLTLRKKAYKQAKDDSEAVLAVIDSFGGVLPFGENVSPAIIEREFHMSKAAFKRAVGHLYKKQLVEIKDNCIRKTTHKENTSGGDSAL